MADEYETISGDVKRLTSRRNAIKIGISALFLVILGTLAVMVATDTLPSLGGGCDSCCDGGKDPPGYPPGGKVGVGIGYTTADLTNYRKKVYNVYQESVWPYAIHQHTALVPGRFLEGLEVQNSDVYGNLKPGYGCSVTYVEPSLRQYPTSVLVLGVDVNYNDNEPNRAYAALYTKQNPTRLNRTVLDEYEDALEDLIAYLDDLCVDVILVYGNVADYPGNANGGPVLLGGNVTYVNYYRNAFRYVSERVRARRCSNVAMAWTMLGLYTTFNSTGVYDTLDDDHLKLWYPGDAYVDWVGTTMYVVNCTLQVQNLTLCKSTRKDVYDFATDHCKPVIIEEQGAAGLFLDENALGGVNVLSTLVPPFTPVTFTITSKEAWKWYFDPLFDEVERYSDVIKILILANTPTLNSTGIIFPGFQELANNEYIRDRLFEEVGDSCCYYDMPFPKEGNDCHSCSARKRSHGDDNGGNDSPPQHTYTPRPTNVSRVA
jgi:hypothetical protein